MKREKLINRITNEVAENKAKILDDFTKAYLAFRWDDYFGKQKKIDFKRLELVEQIKSATERVYFFRLKKGKISPLH